MKNILKVLIFTMFCLCLIPTTKAYAETTTGDFSAFGGAYSGLTWSYDDTTETLTVSGVGDMPNFSYNYSLYDLIGHKKIRHLIIGEGITGIGNYTLYQYPYLEDIQVLGTIKRVGDYAFYNIYTSPSLFNGYTAGGLKTITGMQGVEDIGTYAFYGDLLLTSLPTLSSLKTVGESAFSQTSITSIIAPVLITVGNSSFGSVTTLTTVNAPNLKTIGVSAFEGATALSNVSIAVNPTISLKAFKNTPVHSSYPGKSFAEIGKLTPSAVIAECNDYTKIIRVYGNGEMKDFAYNYGLVNYLVLDAVDKVVIEEGVTNVGAYFLYGTVTIPEVQIADTVKSIGYAAFAEMKASSPKGLLKVTGMQGVENIGEMAFYNSYNLTTMDALPESLTTIGASAFQNTASLNGLVNNAVVPQTIGSGAFTGMGSSLAEGERVVSANSTNTTFLTAIQETSLNHQIIYLDTLPDPEDYTLEEWLEDGNNASDWFTDGRSISTYVAQGGTSESWGLFYGWYPSSFLSFGSASSGWLGFGGSSSMWTSAGGTASSWVDAGGSGSSWVSGGGSKESFIASGGTLEEFSITTPDKVSNSAAQIILTADQTLFGFSFPTDIPIHQLSDFTIVTPSDLEIINLSAAGQLLITSINVVGLDNWVTEDFTTDFKQMKIDSNKFGLSLNGNRADKSTNIIPIQGDLATPIKPGEARTLVVDFKMSGQSKQLTNSPAQILMTLDWYK